MMQILMREKVWMLTSALLVCILLAAQPQPVCAANEAQAIRVVKTAKPPRIDGTLNDPVWQGASRFNDFKTLHPSPGQAPSQRTEVYLTYDRENIYAGFRLFDSEPQKIRSQATERDNPGNDDWVAFCLDTRDDELSAVFFLVTPAGLQGDGTLDGNGSPNTAYDMQWSSAARRTPDGWTAEMAIPFKNLPFLGSEQVIMGFKVARFISHKPEEVDFPEIVPGRAPHLAQFQKIQFSAIQRSLVSDQVPLVDIRQIYQRRSQLRTRPGIDTYEGRVQAWGDASVLDYLVFPGRELKAPSKAFHFEEQPQESRVAQAFERLEYFPGKPVGNLEAFLQKTETTSFIVIKNDAILYEKYFNGYQRDSIVTSFSVAKSFASTLVGIAIGEGRIGSVSDPITKYLPELAKRDARFTRITIRDLLLMSSGLRYDEDEPYYDNRITYLEPDLRMAALEMTQIVDVPGKYWLYNNYHPLLIGMILERVTGKTVTEYLQEKLWSPLGMEYPGSWSIDSEKNGLEKMESGINARAIDFAKFGRLFLNYGRWDGEQIVSEAWVEQATQQPEEKPSSYYQDDPFFVTQGHYYKYFWWGSKRPAGKSDFYGVGNKGQYVYVSPQKHLIVVRHGIDFGLPSVRWVRLFYDFASAL